MKRLVIVALIAFAAPCLQAGNGKVNSDGTVDLTIDFRFAPTQAEIDLTKERLTAFSAKLWDASEGQMRLGKVKIGCGTVDEDLADIWFQQQLFQYAAQFGTLGQTGAHFMHPMYHDGTAMFHEFGHYALFLGDEYPLGDGVSCGSSGPCLDEFPRTETKQCIMHDEDVWDNEFCLPANHDLLRGDNPGCANDPKFGGAPCLTRCEEWNKTTKRYEVSNQQTRNGKSCWETLVEKFPFLTMPSALPQIDPPPGFTPPQFNDVCDAASTLILVLDKSGSMGQPVDAEKGEVCANNIDDDANGQVDEPGCSKARIDFVRAASRQIIDAAIGSGVRVGVVSFDAQSHVVSSIVDLDPNAEALKMLIDKIEPGGATAIGLGLAKAKELFDADPSPASAKAVMIITDGKNTTATDPTAPVADYVDAGIRIFPIATGSASDDPTLTAIANKTNGIPFSSPQPSKMLAAAHEAWTQWRGDSQLVSKTPWNLNNAASLSKSFVVEKGTKRLSVNIAAEMPNVPGLGVAVHLIAPSGKTFEFAKGDPFFVRGAVANPAAGKWQMKIARGPRGAAAQFGSFAVTAVAPRAHLFAWSDRWNARVGERVTITLRPEFDSPLRNVDWRVEVRRPDGRIVRRVPAERDRGVYTVTLDRLDAVGTYAMTASFTTNEKTRTVPGEADPAKMVYGRLVRGPAPRAQAVPLLQRSVTRYFVVTR